MTPRHRIACISVASGAAIAFCWAVATLWFGYPRLSPGAAETNAIILIVLWAIGPAIWFALEWWRWKDEPGLRVGQRYARNFWIGAGAIVLLLAAGELGRGRVVARQYVVAWNLVVDVIRILAWPVLVAVAFILFRETISGFVTALGSRASKIGVFNVTLELSTLPEAQPWSGPAIDDLKAENPTTFIDSSGSLFRAIADTAHADYMTVDLEEGKAWLTSRLFILAALIPRVRTVKRMVFLSGIAHEYVGNASPNAVASALAQRFPWLEEAYIAAHADVDGTSIKLCKDVTVVGHLHPDHASAILMQYLTSVRGAGTGNEWVNLGIYIEHAEWLTPETLRRYLGVELNMDSVRKDPAVDAVVLAKTLLRHEVPYVAIVDSVGRFTRLIDRYRAVDEIVRRELR